MILVRLIDVRGLGSRGTGGSRFVLLEGETKMELGWRPDGGHPRWKGLGWQSSSKEALTPQPSMSQRGDAGRLDEDGSVTSTVV